MRIKEVIEHNLIKHQRIIGSNMQWQIVIGPDDKVIVPGLLY